MLLSAVSALVVAQSSSEIPEGLMNNPAFKLPQNPLTQDGVHRMALHEELEGVMHTCQD